MDTSKQLTIILPRSIDRLDDLRNTISAFLAENDVSDGDVTRVEMSAYEAAVNIIEHGDVSAKNNDIMIDCHINSNEINITMSYYGKPFDMTRVELPDLEEHYRSGKMRGLGIYFIMTLMDRVEYSHENMISTLKMIRKL